MIFALVRPALIMNPNICIIVQIEGGRVVPAVNKAL